MSEVVPYAPYCTQTLWVDHFGAHLAIHGDDVAIDRTGQDSLAEMKAARRFSLIQRFKGPGSISTTNLINRMLYDTADHHLPQHVLSRMKYKPNVGSFTHAELLENTKMLEKIEMFSSGGDSSNDAVAVLEFRAKEGDFVFEEIVEGRVPSTGQRVIYVDGAFDMFTAGHVSFLDAVWSMEKSRHLGSGPFLIVGVYDDMTVSGRKGNGWPVMNMVERALLLLQSRVGLKISCVHEVPFLD